MYTGKVFGSVSHSFRSNITYPSYASKHWNECDNDGCGAKFASEASWALHCRLEHSRVEEAQRYSREEECERFAIQGSQEGQGGKGLVYNIHGLAKKKKKAVMDTAGFVLACEERRKCYYELTARRERHIVYKTKRGRAGEST